MTIVDRTDPANMSDRERRFREALEYWKVEAENWFATETSLIRVGKRDNQAVVVKMILDPADDEWNSGEIVEAFEGRGMVRLLDGSDGVMLLERLEPGTQLLQTVLDG